MELWLERLTLYLLPGSTTFLLAAVLLAWGLMTLGEEGRRVARQWLGAVALAYLVMSTPWGAAVLEKGLDRGYGAVLDTAEAQGAQAIVVLGGGAATFQHRGRAYHTLSEESALRALEAARLYALLEPRLVIASGGRGDLDPEGAPAAEPMREALIAQGVPPDRILVEARSTSTYEQAVLLKQMLREVGIERFVLVTSRSHMWRALRTFQAQGLDPVPSAAPDRGEAARDLGPAWLPHPAALEASKRAAREYLALVYYWARGWLKVDESVQVGDGQAEVELARWAAKNWRLKRDG